MQTHNYNDQVRQAQQTNPEHENHQKLWFRGYNAARERGLVPRNEVARRGYEQGLLGLNLVVLERMPEHLKASHRAAGNWGQYPHNGAEREVMTMEEALREVAGDPDEYTAIVTGAKPIDYLKVEEPELD